MLLHAVGLSCCSKQPMIVQVHVVLAVEEQRALIDCRASTCGLSAIDTVLKAWNDVGCTRGGSSS